MIYSTLINLDVWVSFKSLSDPLSNLSSTLWQGSRSDQGFADIWCEKKSWPKYRI